MGMLSMTESLSPRVLLHRHHPATDDQPENDNYMAKSDSTTIGSGSVQDVYILGYAMLPERTPIQTTQDKDKFLEQFADLDQKRVWVFDEPTKIEDGDGFVGQIVGGFSPRIAFKYDYGNETGPQNHHVEYDTERFDGTFSPVTDWGNGTVKKSIIGIIEAGGVFVSTRTGDRDTFEKLCTQGDHEVHWNPEVEA